MYRRGSDPGPAPQPNPHIRALQPVAHGALDYAELERLALAPEVIIDFSANSNPYGPPPGVADAIRTVPLERYPDRQALALRRSLSSHLGIPIGHILAANGAAELIWLVALAYLQPGDYVLVIDPTFGEYAYASRLMGAEIDTWRASPDNALEIDLAQIENRLSRKTYRLVFVCNPNNPTGQVLDPGALARWAKLSPDTLFVVDEAYIAFTKQGFPSTMLMAPNILTLRSMTKDYALAGLRLGYAVGHKDVIGALSLTHAPWNVNALALVAGIAALADQDYLHRCIIALNKDKLYLARGLASLGLPPLPSDTHYMLVQVGDGRKFRQDLLKHGVLVRDCASFGLPEFVRIATRTPTENTRLLAAMKEFVL